MNTKEIIAFYNVENLFDTFDDPETFDDEFTPEGDRRWTQKKYENKLWKISRAIQDLGTENEVAPFLIGLSEVENEKVLIDLQKHLTEYDFIHFDSPDERGIDVALLYDSKKFFVLHSEAIFMDLSVVTNEPDFTRDILYVNGTYKNALIHIFIMHLPSKRYQDVNREKRILVLQNLKKKLNKIYEEERNPSIIIMGDMNENPDTLSLQENIGYTDDIEKVRPTVFFNPFYENYKDKEYSLYHKNQGMLFDQIILSPYFFTSKSDLKFSESAVFDDMILKEWKSEYKNKPFRTYVGRKYLGGYSDHFPVWVSFNDAVNPLAKYIDSTYLKLPSEANISESETENKVKRLTQEAIKDHIKCVMIRPNLVPLVRNWIDQENSKVLLGTVIDFPMGNGTIEEKLSEARKAINEGADELDFVINYEKIRNGHANLLKDEFLQCTHFVLENNKTIKWIIETAALSDSQIQEICSFISKWSLNNFRNKLEHIYIKSSTGYYPKEERGYSGATTQDISLMLNYGYPLPIKASGGIKSRIRAQEFIKLGVMRIGTSAAEEIMKN